MKETISFKGEKEKWSIFLAKVKSEKKETWEVISMLVDRYLNGNTEIGNLAKSGNTLGQSNTVKTTFNPMTSFLSEEEFVSKWRSTSEGPIRRTQEFLAERQFGRERSKELIAQKQQESTNGDSSVNL